MDLLFEIFQKLEVSVMAKELLAKAYLTKPSYNAKTKTVIVRISNPEQIPVNIYEELTEKFSNYLESNVQIVILTGRKDYDENILQGYIYYYANKYNIHPLKSAIPVIKNNTIYLNFEDEYVFNGLKDFLSDVGFDFEVQKAIEEKPSEVSETLRFKKSSPVSNQELMPASRKPEKFENEDDYMKFDIAHVIKAKGKVTTIGKIFKTDERNLKTKKGNNLLLQLFYISDFTEALCIKRFESRSLKPEEMHEIKEGDIVQVYGTIGFDSYEKGVVMSPDKVVKLDYDPWVRKDEYEGEKHCELHVHTNRSEMDGCSSTSELINTAFKFGSKAVAITDTSVVQAYPLAQQAHLAIRSKNPDTDFKVIYGIEMKMADDQLNIVYNANDQKLKDVEYCVFDLETTGLSTRYDYIIEFGGVIVKNNSVVEGSNFQTFIKPPVKLPPFIVQKTNITDEMLADAPTLEQAIDSILDFIGDRVVVAHNADFDYNFLNDKLIEMGRKPITNVCIDTLDLSKQLVKSRKYYRLGLIAKNYGVEYNDDDAHRGDYDAEVLANVLTRMLPTVPGYPDVTFKQLQQMQDDDNWKKCRTTSITILAKNMAGIKRIYELVSLSHTKYLTYFAKENAKKADSDVNAEPRIVRSEIIKRHKDGDILLGSANMYSDLWEIATNRSQKDLEECMQFYDYIEVQPLSCYCTLVDERTAFGKERLKAVVKNIVDTAHKLGKTVIGTNDVFYTHPYQKIAHEVYIMGKRIGGARHPLYPGKDHTVDFVAPDQHMMTTKEMLDAFAFLGEDTAKELTIDAPLKINNQIEMVFPIAQELHTPEIPGCEEILKNEIYTTAHKIYGDPLPEIVATRIDKELTNVIKNGFSVQYYIAHLLVKHSNADGFLVGSRGSVGSSFIATMANITEVNPLVPHYVCPDCKYSEFFTNNEFDDGFDMPPKKCPKCGSELTRNGHNIPFETFLGFNADKVPDIDLNFGADYQGKAQLLIKDIFGDNYAYRAGTIGTVATKTAFGYIKGYCEETKKVDSEGKPLFSNAYMEYLSTICEDVKRTTGQHPGGIVVIPKVNEVHDFTPIQYPANNPFADWYTTHFAFSDLHDNILKLDILGHVDPTAVRLLQLYTDVDPKKIPMTDPAPISLFSSTKALNIVDKTIPYNEVTGAAGLPEFGTRNARNTLEETLPKSFYELVALSGLMHGTNVWANNAQTLIQNGTCTLKEVIACRDDIMTYLIAKGLPPKESFQIMEKVRKGKHLTPQWEEDMRKYNVPEWYIDSCNKIEYMFPKAHAVAYVMMAIRIAWWKVYYPAAYYAVFFSCRVDAYEVATMVAGKDAIYNRLMDIRRRLQFNKNEVSDKEKALETTLEISLEMYIRGYHFNNVSLQYSHATNFIVDPNDDHGVIPAFAAIDGLGASVGRSIVEQREISPFISKEDLKKRTSLSDTLVKVMDGLGVLDDLGDENQMSLFNF